MTWQPEKFLLILLADRPGVARARQKLKTKRENNSRKRNKISQKVLKSLHEFRIHFIGIKFSIFGKENEVGFLLLNVERSQ